MAAAPILEIGLASGHAPGTHAARRNHRYDEQKSARPAGSVLRPGAGRSL